MKYILLFVLFWSETSLAQSNVIGLGNYIIGVTTPDSLAHSRFLEQESYVKGTLALACPHILTFTATGVITAGVPVTNLVLVFYDNTLFTISCDYSDALRATFTAQHGPGLQKPASQFRVCTEVADKPLSLWGNSWAGADITAVAIYRSGYTAECKPVNGARLTIASQSISALSSECELKHLDPFLEEFNNVK